MAPTVTRLFDLARATLDAVVAHWPIDATPLPDLQFVSNGQVIWDGCELLATAVERTFAVEADVGLEEFNVMGPGFANRAAVVLVTLLRCVPDIETNANGDIVSVPSPAETEESAALILTDAQGAFNAVLAGQKAGEIAMCNALAFESWTAEGPQGGMGGGTLRMRMLLS